MPTYADCIKQREPRLSLLFVYAGCHLHRTGETIAPSFFSSAKALSTSLRSAPRALVTSPAETLQKDQLYTYSPGLPVTILSASDDYRGICLIADENYTLEIPQVRKAIHSSYFSLVQLSEPRMQLSPDDSRRLQELMRLAIQYCSPTHTAVQSDSLRMLYALFLTDLTAVQERTIRQHRFFEACRRCVSRLSASIAETFYGAS